METLRVLPVIQNFLEQGHYDQAMTIIKEYIEILAPYIDFNFPDPSYFDQETSLVLCKLFLLRKDYSKSISYGMRAKALLKTLDPFYMQAFIFRTMDELLVRTKDTLDVKQECDYTKNIREFVLEYIKNDAPSDSLLGFLGCIKEFGLLRAKIVELSKTKVDCEEILNLLHRVAGDEILSILAECGVDNPSFFECVIDALVDLGRKNELIQLIEILPWDKKYAACFYLEDSRNYGLQIKNDNANLILSGQWKQEILSNFLFKNNKTNFKFLESMSKSRAPYMALANSFMNSGTTNDSLYRNNKNLIGGKDWNKFVEFASLGMIHQGNIDPFEILKELLPSLESSSGEPGALMALGLMNAGRNDEEANEYYMNWLTSTTEEVVFGSCIGMGLNAMESGSMSLYEKLKPLFATDSTLTQESALYAVGLIFAATEDKEVMKFIRSIHDTTDFPRVQRICGLATALVSTLGEDRNDLLDFLNSDVASIRSMGLLSLGTAYVSTSNLEIIDKILCFIDDKDDETKRSAVIAISLIGYGDAEIKSSCIIPLAENHNPFVRATAALCLGLFNSGLGDVEVCSILEAMLYDSDELVKQNACIGAGFAFMQGNPSIIPNYKRTLDKINNMIILRTETACVKIGASIGRAICETSGKSAVFSLKNFGGQVLSNKVIGALLFLHSWYWYPLIPCISLCMQPTPVFFFDENLDETNDTIPNSEETYDYLVKLPEIKKSRKFKKSIGSDVNRDIMESAKTVLKSGDKLTYRERLSKPEYGSGIFFRENKEKKQ